MPSGRTWPRASADGRLAGELGPVQVGVQSPGREQLLVLAALADPAVVDDQDLVGLADGGQPVRDDQRGPAGQGRRRALAGRRPPTRSRDARWPRRAPRRPVPSAAAGPGRPAVSRRRTAGSRGRPRWCPGRRAAPRSGPRSAPPGTPRPVPASVAPGRAYARLARIVSWNRCASWVTTPTTSCSESWVTSLMSNPPMRTVPSLGSYSRDTRCVIVVLPAPEGPTRAVSCLAGAVKLTSCRTPSRASVRSGAGRAMDSSDASETSDAAG